MLNEKADNILGAEVEQKEILEFLEKKYGVKYLVTQRTIQRWIEELEIECIQPRPKRNRDIRYKKSDILKLEELKRVNLLKKRNKELERDDREKIGRDLKNDFEKAEIGHYDSLTNMTAEDRRQQDIDNVYDYKSEALNQIKEDKLEMCFSKLFPNVKFDQDKLEAILFVKNEPSMHTEEEYGQATLEFNEKAYIKNYK